MDQENESLTSCIPKAFHNQGTEISDTSIHDRPKECNQEEAKHLEVCESLN